MTATIVGLADSDSYLKWAAATLGPVRESWRVRLVLVRGTALPSGQQIRDALVGTGFSPGDVETIDAHEVADRARGADAVLVATRGAMADVVFRELGSLGAARPVYVTGLPGISVPATRPGLVYRSPADLFLVHSKREVREFERLGADTPLSNRFALATLPALRAAPPPRRSEDGPVVFAVQALVPRLREDRVRLLRMLVGVAAAHPDRRFLLKLRNRRGEAQTHADPWPLLDLEREVRRRTPWPANLEFAFGSMAEHLAGASGFATISSTAVLEAIAAGVPSILLTDFGVGEEQINEVFVGSGLLGDEQALRALDLRHPDPGWLEENYFHAEQDDDALPRIARLIEARRAGKGLPEPQFLMDVERNSRGRAYARFSALGRFDRSLAGRLAPVRFAVSRGARRLLRGALRLVRG